jgi:N-acetylglucosamine-1-phosphate uridyltransferase (contains nucleotidyltransferase and I-patch acetyltransferase domains)
MIDDSVKIWQPCNVYPNAIIGKGVQVGAYSEIGNRAIIGEGVRIGFNCFIPEGVVIQKNAWIGPRVTFCNDRFPPSPRDKWEVTIVEEGARIGAGVTIVCGVVIGRGALIGAGSTVTKNIPAGETWAGCPAKPVLKNVQEA